MTANQFDSVDVSYHWEDELRQRVLRVPVVQSGKSKYVDLLAVREIAEELHTLSKVVIYQGEQITVDWVARNYVDASRVDVTVQAWGEPFKIAVYDAS